MMQTLRQARIAENRGAASDPLDFIPGAVAEARTGHPSTIFFLTADACGVLPPIEHAIRLLLAVIPAAPSRIEAGRETG